MCRLHYLNYIILLSLFLYYSLLIYIVLRFRLVSSIIADASPFEMLLSDIFIWFVFCIHLLASALQ